MEFLYLFKKKTNNCLKFKVKKKIFESKSFTTNTPNDWDTIDFYSQRDKHSQKPSGIIDFINNYFFNVKKIEIYARFFFNLIFFKKNLLFNYNN
jgi:hypothetical protein